MNDVRFGYACINMELQESKDKVQCSRGMIRRTFDKQGLPAASKLALQNATDPARITLAQETSGLRRTGFSPVLSLLMSA